MTSLIFDLDTVGLKDYFIIYIIVWEWFFEVFYLKFVVGILVVFGLRSFEFPTLGYFDLWLHAAHQWVGVGTEDLVTQIDLEIDYFCDDVIIRNEPVFT